jgi:23S rRNA (cytidine1920-2'-O)/16S rRNA (cytidine1409-2'-O)-methyltransferase
MTIKPKQKIRLDQLLVEKNLVPTRTKAQALILAGVVRVNDEVVSKAGTAISPEADIQIDEPIKYVSRGGIKLEGALNHLQLSVQDMVVLDVGASTGGFTDCLLQAGAKHVFAIDVGKGQLDVSLRNNPAVTFKESFHVREFSKQTFDRTFELAVVDVSFISLTKVLPYILNCIESGGKILALIKPQFETQAKFLDKGVLKDEPLRLSIIQDISKHASKVLGLKNIQTIDSQIKGPKGNQETFLFAQKPKK